jgi:hypothetical protein
MRVAARRSPLRLNVQLEQRYSLSGRAVRTATLRHCSASPHPPVRSGPSSLRIAASLTDQPPLPVAALPQCCSPMWGVRSLRRDFRSRRKDCGPHPSGSRSIAHRSVAASLSRAHPLGPGGPFSVEELARETPLSGRGIRRALAGS